MPKNGLGFAPKLVLGFVKKWSWVLQKSGRGNAVLDGAGPGRFPMLVVFAAGWWLFWSWRAALTHKGASCFAVWRQTVVVLVNQNWLS